MLRADPSMIGEIGTTCVPTMVNGGHAINALPQRATALVNCRVFPGHARRNPGRARARRRYARSEDSPT